MLKQIPPVTTVKTQQPQAIEETLLLDLALFDEQELTAISTAIIHQHLYPAPNRTGWSEATQQIMRVFDEMEVRKAERRSTHKRIDARYVSDRALLSLYHARRREEEATLPQCTSQDAAEQQAYRDRYNQRADASKQWPIYRLLRQRGVQIDLYFPGTVIDIFKSYSKNSRK